MNRRHWLQGVAAGGVHLVLSRVLAADQVSQGIHRQQGDVSIDGRRANAGQAIQPGNTLSTGKAASAVVVVGNDAFMVRENSTVHFEHADSVRLVSGGVLSVFGKRQKNGLTLKTPTLTAGIRGTGCYLQANDERTYICLCYGTAELKPLVTPEQPRVVQTQHHESPFYVSRDPLTPLLPAPMLDHTDEELILLESLQGRRPPFLDRNDYQPGKYL